MIGTWLGELRLFCQTIDAPVCITLQTWTSAPTIRRYAVNCVTTRRLTSLVRVWPGTGWPPIRGTARRWRGSLEHRSSSTHGWTASTRSRPSTERPLCRRLSTALAETSSHSVISRISQSKLLLPFKVVFPGEHGPVGSPSGSPSIPEEKLDRE